MSKGDEVSSDKSRYDAYDDFELGGSTDSEDWNFNCILGQLENKIKREYFKPKIVYLMNKKHMLKK